MPLYDNPPHTVSTYTVASSRDAGGGTAVTYSLAQSGVACSINTASAGVINLYAQENIRVTHTVAFLTSVLTTALSRGMKLIVGDTSVSLHIEGIRSGRAYGNVPAFVYADCSQIL